MKNPFLYGKFLTSNSFCNRQKELQDIRRSIENRTNLFIYGERRLGKTSLVKIALSQLAQADYVSCYVDLWPTEDEFTFSLAVARAITLAWSPTPEKVLSAAAEFFGKFAPHMSLDEAGRPVLSFGVSRDSVTTPDLDDVLSVPVKIATKTKKQVVVVFDEFQQILEYPDDKVERAMRSHIQSHQEISYIFLGSRKHLVQKMLLEKSRPLYRSGKNLYLGTIPAAEWLPFIRKRFVASNLSIEDEQISLICAWTDGHPFYTQYLCHELWELARETQTPITEATMVQALETVLQNESYAYAALWESLAQNQRRILIGLAKEPPGVKPYSAAFLRKYDLSTPSSVDRAIDALLARDIIDRDNGTFIISDRFFKLWIGRLQL